MSKYTLDDFTHTINHYDSPISGSQVKRVVAAWGTNGPEDPWDGWEGGFLVQLKDKRYAYVWGWCDYTGWGCQDGIAVEFYDRKPRKLQILRDFNRRPLPLVAWFARVSTAPWDMDPKDLNLWLKSGKDLDNQYAY